MLEINGVKMRFHRYAHHEVAHFLCLKVTDGSWIAKDHSGSRCVNEIGY